MQQVDQWIKDINTAFQYAQVLEDSVTCTHWIMGMIHFNTHRELIQQQINKGSIRTWANLRLEEEQLVQDPVFTWYKNYDKFFNFEWRDKDSLLRNPNPTRLGVVKSKLEVLLGGLKHLSVGEFVSPTGSRRAVLAKSTINEEVKHVDSAAEVRLDLHGRLSDCIYALTDLMIQCTATEYAEHPA
ncbi:hypothetical protein BU25DRAFT_494703 [Macroventuria anomochaeta]|uniref:Uncharacterized protein n=1 Tax=Macroventuria anomochaeta TaxID=301207 RepID=A0ACB6RLN3_9PLEO|nr:uncharacterized protein BU25DRAFT_494703 [Macroventuria anomochaeta]KAF2622826.1 hypothetical protein BU25DRAFT_494703 [Macroventuria anomochaeta]